VLAELTTNQKGLVAETAIVHLCAMLGIGVSRPLDDERYDLILDLRPQLLRVQCKWAVKLGDVVVVRCRRCRRGRNGLIQRTYVEGEIDAIGAYCAELDACYLLPAKLAVGHVAIQLRVAPTRNNQQRGVNWARDYEFGATLTTVPGPIAQLGERRDGIAKAAGSSPAGSIADVSR
jgi:hypothetical protein